MRSDSSRYTGNELSIFRHANNWTNYWGKQIQPYLGESILDVGAGLGRTVACLATKHTFEKWTCLEPDAELNRQILTQIDIPNIVRKIDVRTSYLREFQTTEQFDSVLYIDVIEHILDEQTELEIAQSFLKKGGHLIILVPAHNFLYNEFDQSIGHRRRYKKKMLRNLVPKQLEQQRLIYLDSLGLLASLANKLILKQSYPSLKQIRFWDHSIVPASKMIDTLSFYLIGKSLLGIWKNI